MKSNMFLIKGIMTAAIVLTAAIAVQPHNAGAVYAAENTAVSGQSAAQTAGQTTEQVATQTVVQTETQTTEQTVAQTETQTTEQAVVQTEAQTTEQTAVQTEAQTTEQVAEKTAEQLAKEAEEARKALQNDPNHVHHFKWIAKMNESECAEGTINYMCTECGKIWYFRPIEAYYAFQGDVARRIEVAPENGIVNVKTSHYINFNKQVMQALAERQDVSVHVSFLDQEYKGNRVSFTIPAGQDTVALLDKNGYAGFLYLGGIYGLTLEEAAVVQEATAEGAETGDAVAKEATTDSTTTNETTEATKETVTAESGNTAAEAVDQSTQKKNAE